MTSLQPDLVEPFSRQRDAAHPVRWSPADGDTPAYLTLKGAVERLSCFYNDDPPGWIAETLHSGPLRTPYAFYAIDEAGR
jgi:hypothetical protein